MSEEQLFGSLWYVTLLLFVAAGLPFVARRRLLGRAAIAVYLVALAVALGRVAWWLVAPGG
jgi:hypothetical protein